EGRDGTWYSDSGLTFIFKDVEHVRMAQFVQSTPGEVDLNIVADAAFSDTDRQRITELMNKTIGADNMIVNINLVRETDLIYSPNNKLTLVVRV
ncbi:MAG: hypothetical protein LUC22_04720, partial [Prevotella sp.]|nr:hypothetical protein [Prevotella sp.]